jgi:hypothetical protein
MDNNIARENTEKIREAIEVRQEEDKERLLTILREMPIAEFAVKKSGIGKSTYYRWRHEDQEFARAADAAQREGEDFVSDLSETQVIALIRERNLPAITLWLKAHRPKYANKVEVKLRPHPYASREEFLNELTSEDGAAS